VNNYGVTAWNGYQICWCPVSNVWVGETTLRPNKIYWLLVHYDQANWPQAQSGFDGSDLV
jgi:hypothetical protein